MEELIAKDKLRYHSRQIDTLLEISRLIHGHEQKLVPILQEVVRLLPDSLSDGDITSARIIVDGNEFKSENFVFGEKTSSSPITVFSRLRGKVEAHKQGRNKSPAPDFTEEENHFIEIIANELGSILEQRRTEIELEQSRDELQSLLNNMDDFLLVMDNDGNILHANRTVQERLGYSWDVLMKKKFREIVVGNNNSEVDEISSLPQIEISLLAASGERIPVETRITQSRWKGKEKLIAVARDITVRLKAQQKQQESFVLLRKNLGGAIEAIVQGVEVRDSYTAGHQRRVANLARTIATEMGLPADRIEGIRTAGSIHDIGKISIPSEILSKTTRLLDIEFELIKRHTSVGFQILNTIDFPWPVAAIVLQHHEKINGSGYPFGLDGDMMLVEAKVICVADVVEAMATHRPYRPALGIEKALEEITKNRGILYDPDVVDACLSLFDSGELLIYDDRGQLRPF